LVPISALFLSTRLQQEPSATTPKDRGDPMSA
jgi:hypothetical protein